MEKRQIYFDPVHHKYTDELGNTYISVTTLIGEISPKFNTSYWAWKEARKTGESVKQVVKRWDKVRNDACEKGNVVHELLDTSINNLYKGSSKGQDIHNIASKLKTIRSLGDLDSWDLKEKHRPIYNVLVDHIKDGWTIYSEKRVYNSDLLISGTIDCLAVKRDTFKVLDWKTNKEEPRFISGYYKKSNGVKTGIFVPTNDTFLEPLHYLPYCKGNTYSLQLSLYAKLVEEFGLTCVGLELCHISCSMDSFGNVFIDGHKWIPIRYMESAVKAIYDYRRRTLTSPTKLKFGII